ncbi:MAG TPA: VOC family protein [Tepidisphaeraceae bacterium]|jgi:hypothetical protein
MSGPRFNAGTIAWLDLTVADAAGIRDFYRALIGWEPSPVRMGDYDDYNMTPRGGDKPAAGVCHARGENAKLPPQWIPYITVADLAASVAACERLGGAVVARVGATCCVIRDPAGAVIALLEPQA